MCLFAFRPGLELSFLCASSSPSLHQGNLTELKSFGSPVVEVTNVVAAVMVLMAPGGRVPKDRSWKAAKVMMAKVDAFLESLITFNKEKIPDTCLKAIRPYLQVSTVSIPEGVMASGRGLGACSH